MLEKEVETEEGNIMMERTGTTAESEMKRRGIAVGTERGTGEEIETGIMLIVIETMGETGIGIDIDTVIKNSSTSAF